VIQDWDSILHGFQRNSLSGIDREVFVQSLGCQIQCIPKMSVGIEDTSSHSLAKLLKLVLKRRLNHRVKRSLKRFTVSIANILRGVIDRKEETSAWSAAATLRALAAGDRVRVRSLEEIRETLNMWNELKGCAFFPEMEPYCGTTQIVLKPVNRFVDERDYQIKKCKGVVLLEDVICDGTATYGKCDRACFFFWREEWLERID
jgi:hypothetical protein